MSDVTAREGETDRLLVLRRLALKIRQKKKPVYLSYHLNSRANVGGSIIHSSCECGGWIDGTTTFYKYNMTTTTTAVA